MSTDGETWTEVSHPAYRTALTSPWSDRTIGLTKINSSKPWGVYVPEPSVSAWTSTDLSSASAHDLPPITVVPQYRIPLFFVDGHYIALTEDGIMKSGPVVDVGFSNPGKNGQRTLSLKGPSGRSYELQSAPDANGPWSTLMQFQSQNGNTEQTVTTGDSKGFFRLIMDE